MKKLFLTLMVIITSLSVFPQKSVDALFAKYSERDGFTTITINGDLMKLIRAIDDDDDIWPGEIDGIRILIQNDDSFYTGNFYKTVEKELDRKDYEEFMKVKDSDSELVMLVRSQGRNFTEFLVIAGDDNGEDNVLIQVKGNMTYKEAKDFAERIKRDNCAEVVISCR